MISLEMIPRLKNYLIGLTQFLDDLETEWRSVASDSRRAGYVDGHSQGHAEGHRTGRSVGYDEGYHDGLRDGVAASRPVEADTDGDQPE